MAEEEPHNSLGQKNPREALEPNLFCPKNGLDNGVHLIDLESLYQMFGPMGHDNYHKELKA
jgi:hypothetical protein